MLPTSFLFGSGISSGLELPSVTIITQNIVAFFENQKKHSDGFKLEEARLLFVVRKVIQDYKEKNDLDPAVTYEEIYSFLKQLDEGGLIPIKENAMVPIVINHLEKQVNEPSFTNLDCLAVPVCKKILAITQNSLIKKLQEGECHFFDKFLNEVQKRAAFVKGIFTLNHDDLLEQALQLKNVPFVDGFSGFFGQELRHWEPELLNANINNIHLLKLHGSIGWTTRNTSAERTTISVIPKRIDPNNFTIDDDETEFNLMLLDANNKESNYTDDVFINIHLRFYELLNQSSRLVVCGYGFRDGKINYRIRSWLEKNSAHRMVIVHENDENLLQKYTWPSKKAWEELKTRNQIKVVSQHWTKQTPFSWSECDELLYN